MKTLAEELKDLADFYFEKARKSDDDLRDNEALSYYLVSQRFYLHLENADNLRMVADYKGDLEDIMDFFEWGISASEGQRLIDIHEAELQSTYQ